MPTYYTNNNVDTTSKDLLSQKILNKITKQEIDSKIFEGVFGIFTRPTLEVGQQLEELEVGNLKSIDFDATGAEALTKKNMDFKTLYHKINRRKTFEASVSDAQIKMSMLSKENMASVSNAIVNEIYNSSAIEDFDAMKQLLTDIAKDAKNMVVCNLNGNGENMDAFAKAIQTLATNMTLPSNIYNYSGFKRAFNKKEELVLIIDSATEARINVDSLASAFNMDKKKLVSNIVVIDEMPEIEYTSEQASIVKEIAIGENNPLQIAKIASDGDATITGKVKAFLVDKKAIRRDPIERELETQRNAKGRFTNYYLHATDMLTYSTLKNAIAFIE